MELIPCGPKHSLFKILNRIWKSKLPSTALHRIFSLMRLQGVSTAILEENLNTSHNQLKRLKQEEEALSRRLLGKCTTTFSRITFIKREITVRDLSKLKSRDILGYVLLGSVIHKNTKEAHEIINYIFEAILRPFATWNSSTFHENPNPWEQFISTTRSYKLNLFGTDDHIIEGTYFCQQNTITSVCAHACTSMLLNNCRDIAIPVSCEEINDVLKIDHKNRAMEIRSLKNADNERSTQDGLYPQEIKRALKEFNINSYLKKFSSPKSRFMQFIYPYIESGYPSLLSFRSPSLSNDHVVTVIGHSRDRLAWYPSAFTYYEPKSLASPSSSTLDWVDSFIVHDDNLGPQLSLAAHSFSSAGVKSKSSQLLPSNAIGILPCTGKISMPAASAEIYALCALESIFQKAKDEKLAWLEEYYTHHLSRHILVEEDAPRTAIFRTLLVETEYYLKSLRNKSMAKDSVCESDIIAIGKHLANFNHIWVCEVTEPELYVGNSCKLVDVIVDPNESPSNLSADGPVKMIRFPHTFALVKDSDEGLKFEIQKCNKPTRYLPLMQSSRKAVEISFKQGFPDAHGKD